MRMKPQIIAALDVESRVEALKLVSTLREKIDYFKVGSRLFTAEGPGLIEEIQEAGVSVFLDLKFHDIPATVAGAVRAACGLGVRMLTLHTAGGVEMMKAAAQSAREASSRSGRQRPLLVGVTVLTSMSREDLSDISLYPGEVDELVTRRARRAREAGLDGVVASVREAARIRSECGDGFVLVTPGIRPAGAAAGDQKRTATPAEAARAGADYLVIGRPLYQAASPAEAAEAVLRELE
ncbi:MAG: orotidine-5'-phosphate decarboxylase [Candidatus Krumholzibacteriota bacterium]|nr:orotidine-5'-phosphate decarboxylase [Candidatus Krumholzibacteriota bacterium]